MISDMKANMIHGWTNFGNHCIAWTQVLNVTIYFQKEF